MSVQTHDLFYPMLAMFVWTFFIMLRNVQVRVGAVLKGQLTNEYFELFRGAEPSDKILSFHRGRGTGFMKLHHVETVQNAAMLS